MPKFEVKQSAKLNLTSYSGLALVGQCCQAAQLEAVIDPKLPVSQGMKTSDVIKSMLGLLSLGKSDFEAIEPFRGDRFFKEALGLSKVPGSSWMRQRLDAMGAELRELTDELTLRLLERTEAPVTPHKGYVCADLDTFVMDQTEGCRTPRSGGPERSEGFGAAEHKTSGVAWRRMRGCSLRRRSDCGERRLPDNGKESDATTRSRAGERGRLAAGAGNDVTPYRQRRLSDGKPLKTGPRPTSVDRNTGASG